MTQAIDAARRAKDDAMACATRLRTEAHQHLTQGLLWLILAVSSVVMLYVTDLWMPVAIALTVSILGYTIMSLIVFCRWKQADDRHRQSLERVERTTRAWMERINASHMEAQS